MIEKLLEFISQFFDLFLPATIVDQYERAVVLRFGKFHRELWPGFHWVIPFGMERVLTDSVVTRAGNTSNQVLTTKDGKIIIARTMIRWRIHNIRKALLEIESLDDSIRDITYALTAQAIHETDWEVIRTVAFTEELTKRARTAGWRYGIEVEQLAFTDLSLTKSITLNQNT